MKALQCLVLRLLASTLSLSFGALVHAQAYPTPGTIEAKYYAAGPFEAQVTTQRSFACCDSEGTAYDIYYPPLSTTTKRPIVTWANGSDAVPSQYDYFLKHLAGWGFVVIATHDTATGTGTTVWDAAQFLIDANGNPSSVYYQRLDTNNIAAVGHSQGAMGAIAALARSWYPASEGGSPRPDGKKIMTVIAYALPATTLGCGGNCTATLMPAGASIFFINGGADGISPATQPWWQTGENSIQAYYDATPAGVLKAKATANGLGHNDIQGQPGCQRVRSCRKGVYQLLGYPTAWLLWQLNGVADAHSVFVKPAGELFANTFWSYQDSNAQ